jgi:hypothetical protein
LIKIATPIFVRPKLVALKMGVPLLAFAAIILARMPEWLTEAGQRVQAGTAAVGRYPFIGEVFDAACS